MVDFREVLAYSDQPVTCPKCGSRTEIILDFSHTREQIQVHVCIGKDCQNEFVAEKDEGNIHE